MLDVHQLQNACFWQCRQHHVASQAQPSAPLFFATCLLTTGSDSVTSNELLVAYLNEAERQSNDTSAILESWGLRVQTSVNAP
jgi:hypothetical protein